MQEKSLTSKRLFFALWPTTIEQARLHDIARQYRYSERNRLVAVHRLHLTLSFLGAVDTVTEDCVRQMANKVAWKPFELRFDRIGWFARPGVLWAGCSEVPSELNELVGKIQAGLTLCGIESERRRYQPHITLTRKVTRPPKQQTIETQTCRFDELCLVESRLDKEGAIYSTLAKWPAHNEAV